VQERRRRAPVSRSFEPMVCACGKTIEPEPAFVDAVWSATSYARCVYRCLCGRGYSNAAVAAKRTCISDTPECNVPVEVAGGLGDVLGAALNVRNRTAKRDKFCFDTSEDTVTWTVFRWLADVRALALVPRAAGLAAPAGEADLLLWGAPLMPPTASGEDELRAKLVAICDELGEDPKRRSEPDVVIAWPEQLVFVEVKYQAANPIQRDYGNFARYTDRADLFAVSPAEVAAAGHYELVRNWRIGVALAERLGRTFALVNLGPQRLPGQTPDLATMFNSAPDRRFVSLSWGDLFGIAARELELPRWLTDFITARRLASRWA